MDKGFIDLDTISKLSNQLKITTERNSLKGMLELIKKEKDIKEIKRILENRLNSLD